MLQHPLLPPVRLIPRLRDAHINNIVRQLIVIIGAIALTVSISGTAHAKSLNDEKSRIEAEQKQSQAELAEYDSQLVSAINALESSKSELAAAEQNLAAAQAAVAAAQSEADRLREELAKAKRKLAKAQERVEQGQRDLDAEIEVVGSSVRETQQQQHDLLGIAALVNDVGTGDISSKLQWSDNIFATTQAEVDRLTELLLKLERARDQLKKAKELVTQKKAAADAHLTEMQAAQENAAAAQAQVASLVTANQNAKSAIESQVSAEKERQSALASEAAHVERKIQEQIAREKAEEEARREAERQAAAEAAAKAAKKKSEGSSSSGASSSKSQPKKSSKKKSSTGSSNSGGGGGSSLPTFSMPVYGPLTSSFGQRFHPVLKYWKLHDGTDFAAPCGAPIYAPRSGTVISRYYNGGYGNRLMLSHGMVGGQHITTGYNHASTYVVGVGQYVERGQIIGYVGSTGYSTGCHLHLMVWQNGVVVNPMIWF